MKVALGRFWVTLGPLWAYDEYMCGPGGAEKRNCQKTTCFNAFFMVPGAGSSDRVSRVTLRSLGGHFAYFGFALRSLWDNS